MLPICLVDIIHIMSMFPVIFQFPCVTVLGFSNDDYNVKMLLFGNLIFVEIIINACYVVIMTLYA